MKERMIELFKKMLGIKFICGILLPTVLLIFGYLEPGVWLASTLAVLGIREVGKKFPNQYKGGN